MNDENLRKYAEMTESEKAEWHSIGGTASAKKRRQKKTVAETRRAGGLSIWRGGWGFSVCFLHIERCGSRPVSVERQSFPAFRTPSCTASVPHSLQLIVFGSLFSGRDHGPQLIIGQLTQVHAGHRSAGQTDIDCLFGVLSDGIAHRSEGLGIPS